MSICVQVFACIPVFIYLFFFTYLLVCFICMYRCICTEWTSLPLHVHISKTNIRFDHKKKEEQEGRERLCVPPYPPPPPPPSYPLP